MLVYPGHLPRNPSVKLYALKKELFYASLKKKKNHGQHTSNTDPPLTLILNFSF